MTSQPIRDERLLEALEACRPGGHDLADPSLAFLAAALAADAHLQQLYQRLQQVDAVLAASFRDVPVPDGLEQRLLAALWITQAGSPKEVLAGPSDVPDRGDEAGEMGHRPAVRPWRRARRWLLATGLAGAAAGIVVMALWYFAAPPPRYTREMVLGDAIELFQHTAADNLRFPNQEPSSDYPLSGLVKIQRAAWRPIRSFQGRKGVAYDLTRGQVRAILYVVEDPPPAVADVRPRNPQLATHGCASAAWRERGLMYVLVVEDDRPEVFRSLLRQLMVT